jgi:hypothetical protein
MRGINLNAYPETPQQSIPRCPHGCYSPEGQGRPCVSCSLCSTGTEDPIWKKAAAEPGHCKCGRPLVWYENEMRCPSRACRRAQVEEARAELAGKLGRKEAA